MSQGDVVKIVCCCKKLVLDCFGPAAVYSYGSYGKGKAREDSGIDVAATAPEVKEAFLKASALLWTLTWEDNTLIEPVFINQRYPSPLYEDFIQTGVCV